MSWYCKTSTPPLDDIWTAFMVGGRGAMVYKNDEKGVDNVWAYNDVGAKRREIVAGPRHESVRI